MAQNPSTLYEYYTSQGKALPSLSERAKIFESQGLGSASIYAGTATQNTSLLTKLLATPAPAPAPIGPTSDVPTPPPAPGSPGYVPPASYNNPNFNYNYGAYKPPVLPGGKVEVAPSGFSSISSPAPAPSPAAVSGAAPVPPAPQAGPTNETYFNSLTAELETKRKALEDAYKKQVSDYQTQIDAANKTISDFTSKQEGVIDKAKDLTQPFRADYETAQRKKFYIDENFEANQTLVNELSDLLTEGNELIASMKETTGLASIRNPRIAEAISDVAARTGVIEAVMAARNKQIAQAYTLIDRGIAAMTADKKDRLDYYKTLYDFYETQKDTEGKKLVTLTSDKKKVLENQIGLLENDLKSAQTNADNIKKAMTDPDTALAYAQAGVTLNDNVATINKKLAEYAYSKEVATTSKDMAEKGYSFLTPGQAAPTGMEVVTIIDSKGVSKQWYKKPTATATATTEQRRNQEYALAQQFIKDNPNASQAELEQYIRKNTALSDTDIKSLLGTNQFLTKDYFKTLFTEDQLKAAAKEAGFTQGGFLGFGTGQSGIDKYLDYLEGLVNQYRKAGYNDQEILKLLQ